MTRKCLKPLRNNCKQLALIVLGFIACISLLEAKGFVVWAKRLEVSPAQQVILSAMENLENAWSAVAEPVVNFRPQALKYLTQHGWSDMPADTTDSTVTVHPTNDDPAGQKNAPPEIQADDAGEIPEAAGVLEPNRSQTPIQQDREEVTPPAVEGHGASEGAVALPVTTTPILAQPGADGQLVPLPSLKPEQSRHIVLAGDSMMAVGLAPQLQRELAAFKTTSTTAKAYRAATGLARPDVFNWQKEYPLMIGNKTPDVVIVAIGGNDTQNLDVNKKVLTIGSDEWKAVYEERLTHYLDMLTKDGAIVLWIKLPPMRPAKYNRNVTSVNEVAQKVVSANPKAIWWDVSARFVNDDGKFQEFAIVPPGKRQVRIRQSDGIHLTDNGAKLITGDIIVWLNLEAPAVEETADPQEAVVVRENVIISDQQPL